MKVCVIVGTRPQFIELSPVIRELRAIKSNTTLLYNTEQHFDKVMSTIFFEELDIPVPNKSLGSPPGTHAQQTAGIMVAAERQFSLDKPDRVVVEGDTNTALGAALAASKLKIPIIHVEAGCRLFDHSLPEEVNRVIISHITSLHFAPTLNCQKNLMNEGILRSKICNFGHPLVDAIDSVRSRLEMAAEIPNFGLPYGRDLGMQDYYYVTIHRDHNVDNPEQLRSILRELNQIALDQKHRPLIFAVHPRTRKRIRQFGLGSYLRNLVPVAPVGFVASLSLTRHAYATITDSGGLTKESAILGTPCIILRPKTEWIETLEDDFAQLAFAKDKNILGCVRSLEKHYDRIRGAGRGLKFLFGRPGVSRKIAHDISTRHLTL